MLVGTAKTSCSVCQPASEKPQNGWYANWQAELLSCLLQKLHCEKLQIVMLVSSARSSESFTCQNSFECIVSVLFQIAWSTLLYAKIIVYPSQAPACGGCQGICVCVCDATHVFLVPKIPSPDMLQFLLFFFLFFLLLLPIGAIDIFCWCWLKQHSFVSVLDWTVGLEWDFE